MTEEGFARSGNRGPLWVSALAVFLATGLSYAVGYLVGSRWLLPFLNTLPAYALMLRLLLRGERSRAVGTMLIWALSLAMFGTLFAYHYPERAEAIVVGGVDYRDPMMVWLRTGEGEESRPLEFLPRHAKELFIYLPVAVITAGAGAMFMGAVLMNFMDFFVASAALASDKPWLVGLLSWFPWSLLRVVGYVILGVVAAEPLLRRLVKGAVSATPSHRWLGVAVGFLVADIVVKTTLAPGWGAMVRDLLK